MTLQPNIIPSKTTCQPLFKNQSNFNSENQLLFHCAEYCLNIIKQEDSPWQCHSNLMAYWFSKGQTKVSKQQKRLLHYLHQWYFSKGKPAYLKTRNLAKHIKTSERATRLTIARLVDRKILIRLEYWSDKYQRFRSVLLPNLHKTPNEKLIFILQKKSIPFSDIIQYYSDNIPKNPDPHNIPNNSHNLDNKRAGPPQKRASPPSDSISNDSHNLDNKRSGPPPETFRGGPERYFCNIMKSLKIQKPYIYINILYTNYTANNYFLYQSLTTLNYAAFTEQQGFEPKDVIPIKASTKRGIENMQSKLKLKPKRITLKVKDLIVRPPSINETIDILVKNNFAPESIPKISMSDLLYYVQSRVFKEYFNSSELESFDLNELFKFNTYTNQNKNKAKYDHKLFKMLMRLFIDNRNFSKFNLIKLTKQTIGWWSGCVKNSKNKKIKYTNHNPNLKTKVGFKIYIAMLYHVYYEINIIDPERIDDAIEFYTSTFKRAVTRLFNYSYILNLPKKVSFDVALIDYNNSGRFLKCLTLNDEQFSNFINSNKRSYQAEPESKKSLNNFKRIFIENFYEKDHERGAKRFEQHRPNFSRFLEILIHRIEKYSENGKRVELSGLKLTVETQQNLPVLHFYMNWLKMEIFAETVFRFDEMFSLQNWNNFIIGHMRKERGYSNYWKIVDTK